MFYKTGLFCVLTVRIVNKIHLNIKNYLIITMVLCIKFNFPIN